MTHYELYRLIRLPEYVRRGIPMGLFADTFGFVTRFVTSTKDTHGKYSYNWAWWLPREITLQEFRIGALYLRKNMNLIGSILK